MFKSISCGGLLLALSVAVRAEPAQGAIRIVNAVGRGGPLQVLIDGRSWNEDGLRMGEASGRRVVPAGVHHLRFVSQGLLTGEARVAVKPAETCILIAHAERVGESEQWRIRILPWVAPAPPTAQAPRQASFIAVCTRPLSAIEIRQADGSWQAHRLRPRRATHVAIAQPRGYLPMRVNHRPLPALPVSSCGHHLVVLYEDAQGGIRALSLRARGWLAGG